MTIYYILLLYILLLYILQQLRMPLSSKNYTFLVASAIFVIIAFRDYSVGVDTLTYKELFYSSEQYVKHYKTNIPNITSECLFFLTANMVRLMRLGDRIYFIIISLFMVLSITIFIKRYSKSQFLSYWLYITLGLLALSMSALRQMIALSVILFSFNYLIEEKKVKYVVTVFIASLFHFSAIIMLPIYFLRKIKLTPNKRLLLLFSTVIGTYLAKKIVLWIVFSIDIFAKYLPYNMGAESVRTNPLVILVALAIPLICSIIYKNNREDTHNSSRELNLFNIFYLMSCINLGIMIVSTDISIVSRVSYYFLVCNIILIPNAIMSMRNQQFKVMALLSCLALTFAQFVISTPGSYLKIDHYLFFWK